MANTKSKKSTIFSVNTLLTDKKKLAGVAIILLLLVLFAVLLANNQPDPTAKVTQTRDLAGSTTNTNNTKDSQAATATDNPASGTPADSTAASGGATTSSTSNNRSATRPGTTTSTPVSSGSGGGAGPTPTVLFRIEDGPYTEVDNDYSTIGCSQTTRFTFTSSLTATRSGTAIYHWERSDGARTSDRQLVFGAAGTLQVTNTWDLGSDSTPGTYNVDGWQKIVVTSPNETNSKPSDAAFTLAVNCS